MTSLAQAGSALFAQGQSLLLRASVAVWLWRDPKKKQPRPPEEDDAHKLWHWIEDNGEIVFPLIGILILALVILAVRRGTLSQQEELRRRAGLKEQVIRLMRAKLSLTAEAAAQEMGIDRYHAAGLLEEMTKEGVLAEIRHSTGIASYRLKGL